MALSLPLTHIVYCAELKIVDLKLSSLYTPSWCGQGQIYISNLSPYWFRILHVMT